MPTCRAMPTFLRTLLVAAALGASLTSAAGAEEPRPTTVIIRSADDAKRMSGVIEELKRQGQPVVVQSGADGPTGAASASQAVTPKPAESREAVLWSGFVEGVQRAIEALPRTPALGADIARAWAARAPGRDTVTTLGLILVILAIGAAAAFAVHLATARAFRHRLQQPHADLIGRLKSSGLQFALDAAAIAAFFAAGYFALLRILPQPDVVQAVGRAALFALTGWGAYIAGGRFLLAPRHPERRLMPMPRPAWNMRWIAAYGLLGPAFTQSLFLLRGIDPDPMALTGWVFLGATILTAVKVAWFWAARHDIATLVRGDATSDRPPSLARRVGAVALPWFFIAVAILIWAGAVTALETVGGAPLAAPAGITQNVTLLLPIVAAGLRELVASASRRILAGRTDPLRLALAAVARTVATGAVWIASLAVLARLWGEYLVDPVSSEAVTGLRLLTRAGAAIVTGWAIWTFCRTYFDAHAPKTTGAPGTFEEDGHVPVASRIATVLPLIRNLVLGAVLAVTGLVVLSSLGVEIGPFLAGFGVIGLAISFGSQALVRDIVSGIFFMADDAFRVGEYIDTGRLRGTVEKISLRSVQLRHQNGQVHTIPFGQLQSTTNFSRDWATVKFALRLDRDADTELARRTIKKIGAEMMNDPEFAPEFISPLKMQGIQDITDTAIVIRCKFTCRPFKPTWLQREALKRIHKALAAAGVAFATNAVSVRGGHPSGEHAAAAAISATGARPVADAAG